MPRRIVPLILLAIGLMPACTSPGVPDAVPSAGTSPASSLAWRPVVGACHDAYQFRTGPTLYLPADCSKSHMFQTVYVGEVTGRLASAASSPEAGTPEQIEFWRGCDLRFTTYLGAPWRDFKLKVRVSFPSVGAWDAGARWFSCEATAAEDESWINTTMTGSLEAGAQRMSALKLGCMRLQDGVWSAKACGEPHNAEYVGAVPLDMPWAAFMTLDDETFFSKCDPALDMFLAAPTLVRTVIWHPMEEDWRQGDRSIRCFLWLDDREVSKSLKA